jgi:hypothetical protein
LPLTGALGLKRDLLVSLTRKVVSHYITHYLARMLVCDSLTLFLSKISVHNVDHVLIRQLAFQLQLFWSGVVTNAREKVGHYLKLFGLRAIVLRNEVHLLGKHYEVLVGGNALIPTKFDAYPRVIRKCFVFATVVLRRIRLYFLSYVHRQNGRIRCGLDCWQVLKSFQSLLNLSQSRGRRLRVLHGKRALFFQFDACASKMAHGFSLSTIVRNRIGLNLLVKIFGHTHAERCRLLGHDVPLCTLRSNA